MCIQFDVKSISPDERYDYWHELIFQYFCRAECEPVGEPFSAASLRWNQYGSLGISDVRCDAMRYERTKQSLQASPNEDFLVSLMVEGEANLSQSGRQTKQRPGDIVIYDSARSFEYEFLTPYQIYLLRLPRHSLLSRFPGAENMTATTMNAATGVGLLTRTLIQEAVTMEMLNSDTASARIGSSIMDMLTATLEAGFTGQDRHDDRRKLLLKKAQDYIRANVDDPDLNIDSVATAIAVSTRTLNRLFAAEGIPVMKWLWKERLEQSRQILREGRAEQVTDVALNLGFKSVSHFSRTFKDAYGVTPNTMLRTRCF